jgi:hypothetical protein
MAIGEPRMDGARNLFEARTDLFQERGKMFLFPLSLRGD